MDPLLLQRQLKNNNQDFLDFYNDLKSWGKEMEKKEQERKPQKQQTNIHEPKLQEIKKQKVEKSNTSKKETLNDEKEVKKKVMTYADWDKFDADKECEKIDEDSDSSSDSLMEDLKDQAIIEKEEGNKFVKLGKWNEAIRSYTNAIKYYAYDPIFYANRALCFLKTNQMEKAEEDCNISIKLDNTYVKAYQRRAAAREALNKLEDSKLDLLRVLELEPKNKESRNNLDQLKERIKQLGPQKPISKFSQSRNHMQSSSLNTNNNGLSKGSAMESASKSVDTNKSEYIWPSGDIDNLIKAVQKPPHLRSTKPLVRIPIKEINSAKPESSGIPVDYKEQKRIPTLNTDDIKIIVREKPETTMKKVQVENKTNGDAPIDINIQLTTPKTSVQFHTVWKQLRGSNEKRGEYLKLINPQKIPDLFKDSLESDVFSEILHILAEQCTQQGDETYEYLLNLSKIKRFGALSMFLNLNDKNSLWKMFNHMKEYEGRPKEEIDDLIGKYELM